MKVSLNPLDNRGSVKANHSVELNRGITPGFCISCFLPGGLTCQKKKKKKSLTGKHSHRHIEKRSMLNSIKALKKSIINLFYNCWSFVKSIWPLSHRNPNTSTM